MILSDRTWKAFLGTLIPVRVLIGIQMMVYGFVYFFVEPLGHFYSTLVQSSWGILWIVGLAGGGLWLVVSALAEAWVRIKGLQIPRWVELPKFVVCLGRSRFACYFFVGSVWAALTFNTWDDGTVKIMDFMGPLYVVFITWAAVNDAYQRRKFWLSRATPLFVLGK